MDIEALKLILKAAREAEEIALNLGYKCCAKCKDILPLSEFNTARTAADGRYSYCKLCAKAQRQEYRAREYRSRPRQPYSNIIRPSEYLDCIEVKMYGDNNKWMILDIDVFREYSGLKFYANHSRGMYYCHIRPKTKIEIFHRLICPTGDGYEVDHINHNTLDNRRVNLRKVTKRENLANRRPFGYEL